jgi:beta-glucosidase
LTVDKRVRDQLGRMTLAEKVAQEQAVNWSGRRFFDDKTRRFSPERTRALMPNGMEHITRPDEEGLVFHRAPPADSRWRRQARGKA